MFAKREIPACVGTAVIGETPGIYSNSIFDLANVETSTDKPSSTTGSPAQSLTTTAPSFAASIAIRALTAGAIGTPSSSTAATTSAFSFACVVAISMVFTSAIINSASFIALMPRKVIS